MTLRYTTGESVELGDRVTCHIGGNPIKATVVGIGDEVTSDAVASGALGNGREIRLLIDDSDREQFAELFWPGEGAELAPYLDADVDEDVSFVSRSRR